MWTCSSCKRIFEKANQPHSCKKVPLELHFEGKSKSKEIFNTLFQRINREVGFTKIVSLPCCIHLFGTYDFMAALPKKDILEIRFGLERKLESKRLKQAVPVTQKIYKNCIDLNSSREINEELMNWLKEAYHLKDRE